MHTMIGSRLALLLAVQLTACSPTDQISIRDGAEVLATIEMTPAHEFLAEYDRQITLHAKSGSKTLPMPPDTGGDLPITVTRHSDPPRDFLQLQGGIYILVFDLNSQDYAPGSDSPADEIYTGVYRGDPLPAVVSEWTIDRDQRLTRIR